jgi:prepilin-type N-terminal cleavage/methylation domain-containing protein
MKSVAKHNGFSLIELLVALGIIAALTALAIPSIKAIQKSFDSTGAESMISAALSTARTIAISQQKYAGVRFQKAYNGTNIADADQYMIFIINNEDDTTLGDRYIAIKGYKPIKLPANSGVMDFKVGNANDEIKTDGMINNNDALTDTTTFSVIFSPSGKIVTHDVQTRNKDNVTSGTGSDDTVFNTKDKIIDTTNPAGQFLQDYTSRTYGLGKEPSRRQFVIYECEKLKKLDENKRYEQYLKSLKSNIVSLNPYTGEIIKK